MGKAYFHIHGHSGTDVKHKKAFKKFGKHWSEQSTDRNNLNPKLGTGWVEESRKRVRRERIVLTVLLTSLILTGLWLLSTIEKVNHNSPRDQPSERDSHTYYSRDHFDELKMSAHYYVELGHFGIAFEKYEEAMLMNPSDRDVQDGLLRCSKLLCQEYPSFCQYREELLNYLWVTKKISCQEYESLLTAGS